MVKVCTSQVSALKQPRMFALSFYFSILISLVGNSPLTTNNTRFHLDALFFFLPLRCLMSCFSVFFAPMLL